MPQTHEQIWQESLTQLKMQMTEATFETWVRESRAVSRENGTLVVGVKNQFSKDWLENRLAPVVNRTVTTIAGQPLQLEYVVLPEAVAPVPAEILPAEAELEARPEPVESEPDDAGPAVAQRVDFHEAKLKMGRWLPDLQYDNLFWQPYLGEQTWLFYRHLLMHWTKNLRKKDMARLDMSRPDHHWTTVFRLSYRQAVQWLNKRNQKVVPGGICECHRSEICHRILKEPLAACCGQHEIHDWRPQADGGGRCYYWRPGILHRLYDEGLLTIEISKSGRARVQVWRNLPVLTPTQVNGLNHFLQDRHERWLEDYGYLYDLSAEQWQEIRSNNLVSYLPGYADGQELQGRPPENPLLKQDPEVER